MSFWHHESHYRSLMCSPIIVDYQKYITIVYFNALCLPLRHSMRLMHRPLKSSLPTVYLTLKCTTTQKSNHSTVTTRIHRNVAYRSHFCCLPWNTCTPTIGVHPFDSNHSSRLVLSQVQQRPHKARPTTRRLEMCGDIIFRELRR